MAFRQMIMIFLAFLVVQEQFSPGFAIQNINDLFQLNSQNKLRDSTTSPTNLGALGTLLAPVLGLVGSLVSSLFNLVGTLFQNLFVSA